MAWYDITRNIREANLGIGRSSPFRQDEQRAIATALSDVDGLLGSLDALIAKKKAIKQGPCSSCSRASSGCRGSRGSGW